MQVRIVMCCCVLCADLMTGSGYKIGNRRLHFYFFSTRTWERDTAPLAALEQFKNTMEEIKNANSEEQKVRLEHKLLNNLQVYDFEENEQDVFSKS